MLFPLYSHNNGNTVNFILLLGCGNIDNAIHYGKMVVIL